MILLFLKSSQPHSFSDSMTLNNLLAVRDQAGRQLAAWRFVQSCILVSHRKAAYSDLFQRVGGINLEGGRMLGAQLTALLRLSVINEKARSH